MASYGRATQQSRDTRKTNKAKQPTLSLFLINMTTEQHILSADHPDIHQEIHYKSSIQHKTHTNKTAANNHSTTR